MSTLPKTRSERLDFFRSHYGPWIEQASTIGLRVDQVNLMKDLTQIDIEKHAEAVQARNAAQAATLAWYISNDAMVELGRDLIQTIRAYAETSKDPNVYSRANIDPPRPHTPIAAPGTPTRFRTELHPTGTLGLSWACKNPKGSQGTMYEIRRSVLNTDGSRGPSVFLAAVGAKKFVDVTLPAGSKGVIYEITAARSTARGEPAQFNVNFGRQEGFAVQTVGVKMAA